MNSIRQLTDQGSRTSRTSHVKNSIVIFKSREQAGEFLAKKLRSYKGRKNSVVLGIPRGGVVVAKVVAHKLLLPLDILVVRKIGAPTNPELAIGAVGPRRTVYWDDELCCRLDIQKSAKFKMKNEKLCELRERERILRGKRRPRSVKGKTVLLIDDGVATGATVLVARKSLRKKEAKVVMLCVPVIAHDTLREIGRFFDYVVSIHVPDEFYAVGQFYEEFPQVSDEEVVKIVSDETYRWTR